MNKQIKKLVIELGGKEIEIGLEELETLYKTLKQIFEPTEKVIEKVVEKKVEYVPYYPYNPIYVDPIPNWDRPRYPWEPIITYLSECGTSNNITINKTSDCVTLHVS